MQFFHNITLRLLPALGGCIGLLAACGGGGGGGGSNSSPTVVFPVGPATVQSVFQGAKSLDLSSKKIKDTVITRAQAATSLLASDFLVFGDPDSPARGTSTCFQTTCSFWFDVNNVLKTTASNFGSDPRVQYRPVAVHRNVSLARGNQTGDSSGSVNFVAGYGGWLEHSGFLIEVYDVKSDVEGFQSATGFTASSLGKAANSNPDANGTWNGVMVGADVGNEPTRGHVIQGDASLSFDISKATVDIDFTNIHDLDAGMRRDDIAWNGISVTNGGFDDAGIEGKFYGSGHKEVGGVFERDKIIGAFGATRQ